MTLAIAVLGAVLGVINLWRAVDRDRVKLRVRPLCYIGTFGTSGVCIEVINLSYFPITISQLGFALKGGNNYIHRSMLQDMPKRLEPRASFTAYLPAGNEKEAIFADVRCAFVTTACGCRFTASSEALRGYVKSARAAKKKAP